MVIQCSSCQTRFRLADEKVKEGGTRVRCSRCGQVFTVMPPTPEPTPEPTGASAGGAEPAEPGGHEPPQGEPAAERESATGLDFDFGNGDAADSGAPGADTDAARREDDFGEPGGEEADYDAFSFDEPEAGPAPEPGAFDEISFEEDIEASFETRPGSGEEPGAPEPTAADFDDFDFDSPGSTEEAFSFESDLGSGVRDEFSFEDEEPALPEFDTLGGEEAAGAREPAADGPGDEFEFGDPQSVLDDSAENDLDFSAADLTEDASPAVPAPEAESEAAASPGKPETKPAAPPKRPRARKKYPRKKRKAGSRLPLLLLLLLLVAGGGAGYLYWIGQLPQVDRLLAQVMGEAPQVAPGKQIRITDLESFFVNNRSAGQLFVINGTAVNGHQEPRSALAVRGILFDQGGSIIREKTVYCGNPLTRDELQALGWPQIRERIDNQFGDSLSNLNVAPGKGVPFSIVFNDLPQDLAEFNVEPADSIAGDQ